MSSSAGGVGWVASPGAQLPIRQWFCATCDGGSGRVYVEPGEDGKPRAEAVAHVMVTGHTVTVVRGMEETIQGMALAPPGGA
jgi:hypothetical protein